jgi:hypothetical protein
MSVSVCSPKNRTLALRVVSVPIRSIDRVESVSRMQKVRRSNPARSRAVIYEQPHREMLEVAAESKASDVATLAATSAFRYN